MNALRATALAAASVVAMLAASAADAAQTEGNRDLQGMWTGGTLTPFERPPQMADKEVLTPEQIADRQRQATDRFWKAAHDPSNVGRDNDAFVDGDLKLLANGQTSLVVSPSDGKIPLLPEAERRRDRNMNTFDSYETMSQWDRCITRDPTAFFPGIYNNAYQIVQTPTQVVIVTEMIHDARIIPVDGSPHVDSRVRSWAGDSRGHWEGATLVVDTTNFNGKGWIATAQNVGRIRGVPFTENLHIVERFTRVDAHTLNYEITIEDPQMYRSPWRVSFPLTRDDSYQMFEYACHEGNRATELILGGARATENSGK